MANTASAKSNNVPAAGRKVSPKDNQPIGLVNVGKTIGQIMDGESKQEARQILLTLGHTQDPEKYTIAFFKEYLHNKGKNVDVSKSDKSWKVLGKISRTSEMLCELSDTYAKALIDSRTATKRAEAAKPSDPMKAADILSIGDKNERLVEAMNTKWHRACFATLGLLHNKAIDLSFDEHSNRLYGKLYDEALAKKDPKSKGYGPNNLRMTASYLEGLGQRAFKVLWAPKDASGAPIIDTPKPAEPGANAENGKGTNGEANKPSKRENVLREFKTNINQAVGALNALNRKEAENEFFGEADMILKTVLIKFWAVSQRGGGFALPILDVAEHIRTLFKGHEQVKIVNRASEIIGPDGKAPKIEERVNRDHSITPAANTAKAKDDATTAAPPKPAENGKTAAVG